MEQEKNLSLQNCFEQDQNQDNNFSDLLAYIYNSIYDNYDEIIKDENISTVLDSCKLLRNSGTDREIKCKNLTLLYMLAFMIIQ